MRIRVNGQDRDFNEGQLTCAHLLADLGLAPVRVALERNGQIVPRAQYEDTPLLDGDAIEVVTLVGGG